MTVIYFTFLLFMIYSHYLVVDGDEPNLAPAGGVIDECHTISPLPEQGNTRWQNARDCPDSSSPLRKYHRTQRFVPEHNKGHSLMSR